MRHAACSLLMAVVTFSGPLSAQSPSTETSSDPGRARGFVQIAPGGALIEPSDKLRFYFKAEQVRSGDSISSVLERNGLYGNAATIEAVRKLNPGMVYETGTVKPGQNIKLFAPTTPGSGMPRVTLVEPSFSRAVFTTHRQGATQVRLKADAVAPALFETAEDARQFTLAARELEDVAVHLDKAGEKVDVRQLALSSFYLEQASLTMGQVVAGSPGPTGKWDKTAIGVVETKAISVRGIKKQFEVSGTAFSYRKVTVRVEDGTGKPVNRLRVYVLPLLALQYPRQIPDGQMLALLQTLSFEQQTSPSTQMLETADLAIWVGPDHEHQKMVGMIKAGHTPKHKIVSSGPANASELSYSFVSPSEVTRP